MYVIVKITGIETAHAHALDGAGAGGCARPTIVIVRTPRTAVSQSSPLFGTLAPCKISYIRGIKIIDAREGHHQSPDVKNGG